MARRSRLPRVGLVLGAGGMLGGAWLAGALEALHERTGIAPAEVEVIVGTSAGSALGALAAHGVAPAYLAAYACGGPLEGLDPASALPEDAAGRRERAIGFRLARAVPLGPASWRGALGTLARPHRHPPAALLAAWLPTGPVDPGPLRDGLAHLVGEAWPERPRLWVVGVDAGSGRRTVFGRPGAPEAPLPDAVAASCAVPGFYRPVRIGGRRYVDGGVRSMSNLDLLEDEGLDLVVALNPTSSAQARLRPTPNGLAAATMRQGSGRRLRAEAARVRAGGTRVLLLEPGAREAEVMGWNLMRRGGREELAELAARTVGRALRGAEAREALAVLLPRTAPRHAPGALRRAA